MESKFSREARRISKDKTGWMRESWKGERKVASRGCFK